MEKYMIKWHDTLDSTNSEAAREAANLDNLSVIAASCQTAGRGQRGNRWSSARGENLTFSIFLRFMTGTGARPGDCPSLAAAEQFAISGIATLAQCRLLADAGIEATVKWPNDIYCGDRKISGILVENTLSGKLVRTSVAGIGLNVNQKVFPPELPNPVSMSLLTGREYDVKELLGTFMDIFTGTLGLLWEPQVLKEEYESRLYRRGVESSFADISSRDATLPANALMSGNAYGDKIFRGTIEGISSCGLLQVRTTDGAIREFGFKEIAYII